MRTRRKEKRKGKTRGWRILTSASAKERKWKVRRFWPNFLHSNLFSGKEDGGEDETIDRLDNMSTAPRPGVGLPARFGRLSLFAKTLNSGGAYTKSGSSADAAMAQLRKLRFYQAICNLRIQQAQRSLSMTHRCHLRNQRLRASTCPRPVELFHQSRRPPISSRTP